MKWKIRSHLVQPKQAWGEVERDNRETRPCMGRSNGREGWIALSLGGIRVQLQFDKVSEYRSALLLPHVESTGMP